MSVLVEQCGAERRSPELLTALAEAFAAAGLWFDPDFTDPRLELDTTIRFSRHPLTTSQADGELFPSEFGMETYLAANLAHIAGMDRLRLLKTQFPVPGGNHIDILCEDLDTGDLVVVELKRALPDRGVVSQTLEYVRALDGSPFAKGRKVRGLIVTGLGNAALQADAVHLAASYGYDLTWVTYSVAVTLTEAASTITSRDSVQAGPGAAVTVEPEPAS